MIIPQTFQQTRTESSAGVVVCTGSAVHVDVELQRLAQAFVDAVAGDTGLILSPASPNLTHASRPVIAARLVANLESTAPATLGNSPHGAEQPVDERYRLTISDTILIEAATPQGIAAGFASLRQLIATSALEADGARRLSSVTINDGPRYSWRSLKLDVARFFYPVAEVKRVIDLLSAYKLNALQLHLVDNEGWRVEVKGYPELAAASDGYYTHEDLADIAAYARDRAITVIAEIDLPGHCAALLNIYPELGVLEHTEGHDIAYVDPTQPALWTFLRATYSQMLSITGSEYIHLGCDEAFRMPNDKFTDFVHGASALVREIGGQPIAYQEASRGGLLAGSMTQFWVDFAGPGGLIDDLEARAARGEDLPFGMKPAAFPFYREGYADLARASQQNLKAIVSPTLHAYFDTPYAEASTDSAQEAARGSLGMPVYAPQRLDTFGDWDPQSAFEGLDPTLIAGVEAALWSDTIHDAEAMQLLLLPRLPGFAERAWSHTPRDWSEFRQPLAAQAPTWRARGLHYFSSSLVDWQ